MLRKFARYSASVTFLVACGGGESKPAPWQTVVESGGAQKYSYSFSYLGQPPEGRALRATGVTGVGEPCRLFRGEDPPADFEAFHLYLPRTEHGTYDVAPHDDAKARVEIVSVEHGEVTAKRFAIAGSVTYAVGATTEEDWAEHRPGEFDVDVTFDSDPIAQSECEAVEEIATGSIMSKCTCRRQSGLEVTCESSRSDYCCDDVVSSSSTVSAKYKVTANACAEQCTFTAPELAAFCGQLH